MEQKRTEVESSVYGDDKTCFMLNAVASLLSRQQDNREQISSLTAPLLVLTNMPGKDSLLANVIMGKSHSKHGITNCGTSNCKEAVVPSFEQVHALATANLVASTQRVIAKQLAEESLHSKQISTVKARDKKICKQVKRENSDSQKKIQTDSSVTDGSVYNEEFEPKPLQCSFDGCNRKFAWLNHLKYHELTHTNNRQYKCPYESCSKTFFTAQRLNVHQLTHTGEKPFQCTHQGCGKTFTTAGNLKNHQRIHTGEQPFVCDVHNCKRRFTEQSSLRKHKLTHSGDKPFECDICGKKFTQSGSRRQHLIRHHLDEEFRNSFKQESKVTNILDDANGSHMSKNDVEQNRRDKSAPQVLVLKNSYEGLHTDRLEEEKTEELVVLSQNPIYHAADHSDIPSYHPTGQNTDIPIYQAMEQSEDIPIYDPREHRADVPIYHSNEHQGDMPIYHPTEHPNDIVYGSDILDHEEVTHSDYVSSHVDYSVEISDTNYSHHPGDITHSDEYNSPVLSHSETDEHEISVSEYVPTGVASYDQCKAINQDLSDSNSHVVHSDYDAQQIISDPAHFLTTKILTKGSDTDRVVLEVPSSEVTVDHPDFKKPTASHVVVTPFISGLSEDRPHPASGITSHTLGQSSGDRDMDPMMECDDEP
ncbi:unnamed protein product [Lymnaea stagnalis]|uniref:C2H2-type domain-containing protein n=1 Tax=Lymnaea stagnalis TaxID=6523 RepID=A0AAV2I0K9_LYMST